MPAAGHSECKTDYPDDVVVTALDLSLLSQRIDAVQKAAGEMTETLSVLSLASLIGTDRSAMSQNLLQLLGVAINIKGFTPRTRGGFGYFGVFSVQLADILFLS